MRPRSIPAHGWLGLCVLRVLGCSSQTPVGPPTPVRIPSDQNGVLAVLQTAYATRDIDLLASILAGPEVGGGYRFFLGAVLPDGTTNWDRDEELRIHRRLFDAEKGLLPPDSIPEGFAGIAISGDFGRESDWREPLDPTPPVPGWPDPLDPTRWRRLEAWIRSDPVFGTTGPNEFRLEGHAFFVVVEELAKPLGTPGKFLLYRWEDDGSWGGIKAAWR
jgi:hypothetical protein